MSALRKVLYVFYPFILVYRRSQRAKAQGKLIEHYLLPILMSVLITFVMMRFATGMLPERAIHLHGTHIHHFVIGIALQNIAFLLLLCSRRIQESPPKKYLVKVMFGIGCGLILDELHVVLTLDSSAIAHHYYYGVVWGSIVLIICILTPPIATWLKEKLKQKVSTSQ